VLAKVGFTSQIIALVRGGAEGGDDGSLQVSCAAMWLMSSLVADNLPLQCLVARTDVLTLASGFLASPVEDVQSSAAWLICKLAMNAPSVAAKACDLETARGLMRILTKEGSPSVKGLAAWAVRALVVDNIARQLMFVNLDCVPSIGDALAAIKGEHYTQASLLWVLGTLVVGLKPAQDQLREHDGGRILRDVIACLGPGVPAHVQSQAAAAVYSFAARNAENQSFIANAGGIHRLVALLPRLHGSARFVEKIVAALLALTLKHSANQFAVTLLPGVAQQVVDLLGCGLPRIQGIAAGLVRTMVSDQPELQSFMVVHGVLPSLLEMFSLPDFFAQEQAVAAVYHLIAQQPENKARLLFLGGHSRLCDIVEDCTKPTKLAYACAIMALHMLCDGEEAATAAILARPRLVPSLLRLSHPSNSNERVRNQADRLLRLIALDVLDARPAQTCLSVLHAVVPFIPGAAFECPVCMADDSVGECVYLPCFHAFHVPCITTWLASGKDSCPLCKTRVLANLGVNIL